MKMKLTKNEKHKPSKTTSKEEIMNMIKQNKPMRYLAVITLILGLSSIVAEGSPQSDLAHATITEYVGPATCVACHSTQAQDVFHSVHYQWSGPTPNVFNIPGNAGKGEGGFNTYCGTPVSSPSVTCGSCHGGYGKTTSSTESAEQLNNIDCLMCHQENYKRKWAAPYPQGDFNYDRYVNGPDYALLAASFSQTDGGLVDLDQNGIIDLVDVSLFSSYFLDCTDPNPPCDFEYMQSLTFTDYLGTDHTWQLPIEDAQGNFQYGPDEASMSISILEAARTVHLPTKVTCLRCHAYAGGGDGVKRGDLSSVSADPGITSDFHMSSLGANKKCRDCHQFQNHKVQGRGLDLRPNDRPEMLTCTSGGCHVTQPHSSGTYNRHTARLACQTCHIPKYAKDVGTEVQRDWNTPLWSGGPLGGQGGYKPGETHGSDLIPTYKWFDGTSNVYVLGQTAQQDANGDYVLADPNGFVDTANAMIYPMKVHRSNTALHDATGQLIPHSTFKYFVTGDMAQAVQDGMDYAGLTGAWSMVNVINYQTINHGVEPKTNALYCGRCHEGYTLNGGDERLAIDFQGELGYELKDDPTVVCIQCHNFRNSNGFRDTHERHVIHNTFDCSWCHNFSRQ
jgi:hypothetical protein